MGIFSEFAESNSRYLVVPVGGEVKVQWTGEAEKARNGFGKLGFEFKLQQEGHNKSYFISNVAIIKKFDEFKAGDLLKLSRTEKDANGRTKLSVEKI